jgi:nucleoside-diphosphate-sugar epimerase
VVGDSMIDDHITDGDYVIVEPRRQPRNGEMVVALLEEGEATLKRFYREKARIRLQPANEAFEPIYVDPRAGDVRDSQADIGKAQRLLGYEPGVTFEEGLGRTVAWYRESVMAAHKR